MPSSPRAFSRERKLALPVLVATLVSGLCKRVQTGSIRCTNRAHARTALKPLIPAPLLGRTCVVMLQNFVKLIASQTFKQLPELSRPRPNRPKPHKHMGCKAC